MRWLFATIAVLGSTGSLAAGPVRGRELHEVGKTSRVTYYASGKRRIDVKRTEAFLDRLATLFGKTPTGWRLSYYRHDELRIVHPVLGERAIGMTDVEARRIDSVQSFHPHELVHAAAGRLGNPPLVFAEGLAVALTSEGRWYGMGLDERARRALAAGRGIEPYLSRFTDQDLDAAYAVAGSWVSYLLDAYGIEAFTEFLRGCGSGYAYEAAFQQAFGRSVARAANEWQSTMAADRPDARPWWDAASWPGSLQRSQARLEATVASGDLTEQPPVDAQRGSATGLLMESPSGR